MEANEKKEKKPNKFLKAMSMCLYGILFGMFAAVTFFGVDYTIGVVQNNDFLRENIPLFRMLDRLDDDSQGNEGEEKEFLPEIEKEEDNSDSVPENEVPEESVILSNSGSIENTTVNNITTMTDVSEIVKTVMPAIVSIVNQYTVIEDYGYFGSFEEEYEASGTGIIVGENDTEIIIVTNYHVIEDADRLEITFADDSVAEAMVKGTDKDMDLAVIAVDISLLSENTKQNIAVATLGDSNALEVGEPAIAIGNALGYGQSVTTGVISAVNRQIGAEDDSGSEIKGKFIQTDAAINPGNSGGALLNMKGEVIGINSNKIGGEAIEGMGYAIPISKALPILEELMTKVVRKKVDSQDRGYIGITGYGSLEHMYYYGGDMPYGVYVDSVENGSPASIAQIKSGDVITKFGDYDVESMDDLDTALWYYKVGETVVIEIYRENKNGEYKSMTVTLTLGKR